MTAVLALAPTAPSPTPKYLSIGNLQLYLAKDKVAIADNDPTAISIALANELIASGETMVEIDLSPYYVTDPMLMTKTGGSWLTLPTTSLTYKVLFDMCIIQSSIQIIGWFIANNTDALNDTLSYFQNYVEIRKNKYKNFIEKLTSSGNFQYSMFPALLVSPTGIKRTPTKYARAVSMGVGSYVSGQLNNPQQNFDAYWVYTNTLNKDING